MKFFVLCVFEALRSINCFFTAAQLDKLMMDVQKPLRIAVLGYNGHDTASPTIAQAHSLLRFFLMLNK